MGCTIIDKAESKMVRRVYGSFFAQFWTLVLSLAERLLLVGILLGVWGADLYADWAIILAAAGLVSMGEMGLNVYFGNSWQRSWAHHDEKEFQRAIGVSLSTYAVLGFCLGILVAGYALVKDFSAFSFKSLEPQVAVLMFILLAGTNVLKVMRGSISQIYRGRGQFAAGIMVNSFVTLATILSTGVAALLGASPLTVTIVYILCDLCFGWGVMLYDLHRRFPSLRFHPQRPSSAELKRMFSYGKWYGLLQGTPVVWVQAPVLILGTLGLGGASLVSFLLARTLVNFSQTAADMLGRSVGVETATALHLGEKEHPANTLSDLGVCLSGLAGAIVGGLMIFGVSIIGYWSGNPELFNFWIFFWLLVPSMLVTPTLPFRNLLEFANIPKPVASARLVQIFVGLVLCYGFARTHGVTGAAAGLAIGEMIGLGTFLPIVGYRHITTGYLRYFFSCLPRFLLAAAWSALVAWLILEAVGAHYFTAFIISGLGWGIVGFLPALVLAVPQDKRTALLIKGMRLVRTQKFSC